ncbi:hypothetical protein HYW36_01705 [Candidatus Saccharibacteria bacterium]|nr:hypothetical protein [Candidatus Saccharibacteria bacterium]
MSKANSIVEINDNRYDAVTGQLITAAKKAAGHVRRPAAGQMIDGFTRSHERIKAHAKRSIQELTRKPERSKTLMRSIVKKTARAKSEDKIKAHKLSPDYARASRAGQVAQNPKVQRFGLLPFSKNSGRRAVSDEVVTTTMSLSLPSAMSNASHHRLERLLDYALAHADAHKKTLVRNARNRSKLFGKLPKWVAVCLLALLTAALAGFFIWQRVPAASLKLASAKARVNASLPTPISGYKIGPITAQQNAVVTTMQSVSDASKKYTVTEQSKNQPAASLAASLTTTKNTQQVQTVQDQDKTYILSQDKEKNTSTAVCTKGNNTINVEGSSLNPAQLLEAAKNACKN